MLRGYCRTKPQSAQLSQCSLSTLPPAYDTPDEAVVAYNEEARRLGKELVKIDEKISDALRAEAALRCKGSVTSASSTSKPSADRPRGRAPQGTKGTLCVDNKGAPAMSGYKGIKIVKSGNFVATISMEGEAHHLGSE